MWSILAGTEEGEALRNQIDSSGAVVGLCRWVEELAVVVRWSRSGRLERKVMGVSEHSRLGLRVMVAVHIGLMLDLMLSKIVLRRITTVVVSLE